MTPPFVDRRDAGRRLASSLVALAETDVVVLALPRGGVPVAYEIALRMRAPLDVLMVRKLGVPGREELAMGAIATGGTCVMNDELVRRLRVPSGAIEHVVDEEREELERRERAYRGERTPTPVRDRVVFLVDDGLATGATMRAAAQSLRQRSPRRVVAAVPVGSPEGCAMLSGHVDHVVCLEEPVDFVGVSRWYGDFSQTTDEEVRSLLSRTREGALRDQP